MSLTQEIYTQLLELYAQDLEVENIGLERLVLAYRTINDMKTMPVPSMPAPVTPYIRLGTPWNPYPIWCATETTGSKPL